MSIPVRFGINVDFGSVPVYANILRHCLYWSQVTDANNGGGVAVDQYNCPTQDFSLNIDLIETKTGPNGDTFPIRFPGRATVTVGYASAAMSITNVVHDPAATLGPYTGVTTALLTIPAGTNRVYLYFANTRRLASDTTATGLDARYLTVMRPIAPGSTTHHDPSEKWNRALIPAFAPWKGGYWRDLDTGLVNDAANLPVQSPANRTMPFSPIQNVVGATRACSWEDRIELANFLDMGLWTNFPDTGTDALWQLELNIAKFGSDATGTAYTGASGANPWPGGLVANAVHAPLKRDLSFEYGNENWNTFAQNTRIAAAGGAARSAGTLNCYGMDPLFCMAAHRLLAMADLAAATFPGGLNTKYFPILATQIGPSSSRQGAEWLKHACSDRGQSMAQNIAGFGGAGYEGMTIGDQAVGVAGATVDEIIAGGFGNPNGQPGSPEGGIPQDAVAAALYGVAFASYECGLCTNGNDVGSVGRGVKHDPRFAVYVASRAQNMVDCGCKFITAYAAIRGQWSILDSITDLTHPEWLAWSSVIARYPMDGRTPVTLAAPAAPCFADPSFEQVRIDTAADGYQYQPGGGPWTFAAAAGVNGPSTGFINSGQPVMTGTQVGFLQGTGSISQTVAGFAAVPYRITGRMNRRLTSGPLAFDVLLDGAVISTFTPAGTTQFETFATAAFTPTAGSHAIAFRTTSNQDVAVLLDDLAIVPAPSTPSTPTPPTVTLQSIAVTPTNQSITGPTQYAASGTNTDGSVGSTAGGLWATTLPGASITSAGLLTPPAQSSSIQSGNVTCTVGSVVGTTGVTVPASAVVVVPPTPVVPAAGAGMLLQRLHILKF